MRTWFFGAIGINIQRVLMNTKTTLVGGFVLKLLNFLITKFFDMTTLQAHNMVMMAAFIQLKYRLAAFKVVAQQQACLLKLGKYTVNRCQAYVFASGN